MVVAPGRYVECAVVKSGRFAIRAVISGSVTFDGRACQNKAAFVIKGSWVDVGGLRFCNVRVPDRNGAGLRIQGGDVTVRLTTFEDGENGILTNMDPIGTPSFERSISAASVSARPIGTAPTRSTRARSRTPRSATRCSSRGGGGIT